MATDTIASTTTTYWWTNHRLQVAPVLHPETGNLLAYAVCAKSELGQLDGVVAVNQPEESLDKARWAATTLTRNPEMIDLWIASGHSADADDYRDRQPFVPLPFEPTRTFTEDEHTDLYCETLRLAKLVWANRSPLDPLSIFFEAVTRPERDDGYTPDNVLLHAHAAFHNLPEAERRAMLSGWHLDDYFRTTDEIKSEAGGNEAQPLLCIRSGDGRINVEAGWDLTRLHEQGNQVGLQILAGMTKEATVTAIRNILAMVERDWDNLIVTRLRE